MEKALNKRWMAVAMVWDMEDLPTGLMALTNLTAILMLGEIAFEALKDYSYQKKQGKDPIFNVNNIEGLKNVECWGEIKKEVMDA